MQKLKKYRLPTITTKEKTIEGYYKVFETYYDNILFSTQTHFICKDSTRNLYDDIGRRIKTDFIKYEPPKPKKKVRLRDFESLTFGWLFLGIFTFVSATWGLITMFHYPPTFIMVFGFYGMSAFVFYSVFSDLETWKK